MDILVPIEGSRSLDNYSFDYLYLREAIDYLRKRDPRFLGWSLCALAGHAGLAESTFKKLLAGSILDPRSSTLWMLCTAFELDPRRMMKLPIPASQKSGSDPAVVEDLRRQLTACAEQKRLDELEMARLRKLVLEKGEAKVQAETRVAELERTILSLTSDAARHRLELKRHRWSMLAVTVAVFVLFSISFFA